MAFQPILKLREALEAYWREQNVWGPDIGFYTPEEWFQQRGETMGSGGLLHVTFEGPLNHAMNMYDGQFDVAEGTRALCERFGYWFEMGYAWTMHLYRL